MTDPIAADEAAADMTSDESFDWTMRLLAAMKISREAMVLETLKLHERLAELDPVKYGLQEKLEMK